MWLSSFRPMAVRLIATVRNTQEPKMMHLLMTSVMSREECPTLVEKIFTGDLRGAVRAAQNALDSRTASTAQQQAAIGRLLGRVFAVMGRLEEAEELFQRQLQRYAKLHRNQARWLTSLDAGILALGARRMALAARHFTDTADDATAPAGLRLEAMVGLASAFVGLGEHRSAQATLGHAQALVDTLDAPLPALIVDYVRLDLQVTHALRSLQCQFGDSKLALAAAFPSLREMLAAERALEPLPMAAKRMRLLASLHPDVLGSTPENDLRHRIRGILGSMLGDELCALEEESRIDAAIACVTFELSASAQEWLGALCADDARPHLHRCAVDLMWCQSRLLSMQGRHAEAMGKLKQYAQEMIHRLKAELPSLARPHFLDADNTSSATDPSERKLPIRYRPAYRYIMANLSDRSLSIEQAAAHIEVTVRSLQTTFRLHLGMTPTELIRRRRMEAIRADLLQGDGQASVLDLAHRWGVTSRSTLTQNYRVCFGEAPTRTLRPASAAR